MRFADDIGNARTRAFRMLGTAEPHLLGAEPPNRSPNAPPRILRVDGQSVWLHGVQTPPEVAGYTFRLPEGEETEQAIADYLASTSRVKGWSIEAMNLPPGRYFPRMARPHHQHPGDFPTPFAGEDSAHAMASAGTQIALLVDRIRHCFQVVSPVEENFDAFGAEFRSILLLAATEFEAQCKAVMRANGYIPAGGENRWNTNDYFLLEEALRLGDYSLSFPEYPWLKPIAPFRRWSSANPSSSLLWYDAYNLTKHDREAHANKATMMRAIEAMAAVVVIGLAQFGIMYLRRAERWRDMFEVQEYPRWSIGDTHGTVYADNVMQTGEPIDYPF